GRRQPPRTDADGPHDGTAAHRRAAADAHPGDRGVRPAGAAGAALPLPRPLRRSEQSPRGTLPLHRSGPRGDPCRRARGGGSGIHAPGSLPTSLAASGQLSPAYAGADFGMAAAREAIRPAALASDTGIAGAGAACLCRQLSAFYGSTAPRRAADHPPPYTLPGTARLPTGPAR